jgi:hypothetical protein
MMLLFNCVAALTGVCTICIDPEGGEAYASVLEPMTALGPNHVATFMHQFCMNLVGTIRDHVGVARENWQRMLERLDRQNAVRDLPQHVHVLYLAGALYASGVVECWRDDSKALEYANRLQGLKLKLYEMSADQVRMMYYANRGDIEQFERYRQKVEVHAIQRGTAWQVETWTYSGLVTVYARTGDAARLKECVERLKRESATMPSLRFAYARALGAYLVVRGTPSEALKIIGEGERPMGLVGWCRGEGLRARAFNALGDHESARETCRAALKHLTSAFRWSSRAPKPASATMQKPSANSGRCWRNTRPWSTRSPSERFTKLSPSSPPCKETRLLSRIASTKWDASSAKLAIRPWSRATSGSPACPERPRSRSRVKGNAEEAPARRGS